MGKEGTRDRKGNALQGLRILMEPPTPSAKFKGMSNFDKIKILMQLNQISGSLFL